MEYVVDQIDNFDKSWQTEEVLNNQNTKNCIFKQKGNKDSEKYGPQTEETDINI